MQEGEREGVCARERKRTALTCIMIEKLKEKERERGGNKCTSIHLFLIIKKEREGVLETGILNLGQTCLSLSGGSFAKKDFLIKTSFRPFQS